MTLREYILFWQETYDKSQSRPTTYAAHNYVFKNHILPGLGDILLAELTSEMVGEFLEERRRFGNHRPGSSGLGEETMRHIHRLLQQCLDQAIRDGLLTENPAKAFRYRKSTTVKANIMTPLEMEDYLDAAERLGYLPMFMLALTTGLRQSELIALKWSDLDIESRTLTIAENRAVVRRELVEYGSQTRSIRLTPEVVDLLIMEHSKHPSSPLMFMHPATQRPYSPQMVRRMHDEIIKEAGIDHIRYVDLRHTCAILALKNGMDNTLLIQPIEVKTRDESPDATITKSDDGRQLISGHAAGQIASIVGMLKEIFSVDENSSDMFISARREVLKYQIVSECFRNVHDSEWQKRWCGILKKAFGNGASGNINIQVSGLLMHIKLSEVSGGKVIQCAYADGDEGPIEYRGCPIEYRLLTAKEIQQEVLGEDTILKEPLTADYDSDETPESNEEGTVVYEFGNPSYSAEMREQTKSDAEQGTAIVENGTTRIEPIEVESQGKTGCKTTGVSSEEIEQLVKDFKRSCGDYHVALRECEAKSAVVGPSVIRIKFKLGRGQALQGLASHLEDIGREMKRTGVIIQQVPNSDELLLDVPRLQREKVLFKDVISSIPKVTSPEQLLFPLGRTPNGKDLIEDLSQMPHMLVGGSTGSGKSVFLFSMLAALLMTHPEKEDMQLILSSSKLEDFIHFEGLPHLYSGRIISDATEATKVIKEVIFEESERRGRLLAEARVANIVEYNKKVAEKLAPIVVVIDEFADLADQLETTKEKNAFYKPVQRIAQAGRSRGIHLVICTQRPEAKLVPSTTKAQLNGRVALRVNDGISSRMIIEEPDAQYLQKHGDMIYRNGDIIERAQGYLIEIEELDKIVDDVIHGRI